MKTSLLTLLVGLILAALAIPAGAAPGAQNIPTPTPYPAESAAYRLSVVGGETEVLRFTFPDQDGFTFGESTVQSFYPRGLEFTLSPTSANGAIQDVTLRVRYDNGSGTRAAAAWDADRAAWVAWLWESGGVPAWVPIRFSWRITDASGASAESEPRDTVYADPTRSWFRAESAITVLYWFGLSEDDPDRLARAVLDAVAATGPRRVDGFGQPLSYRPASIVYGSREAIREMYNSDSTSRGFASYDLGVSVLSTGNAPLDEQIEWLRFVVTHELVHLVQFDVEGGMLGPMWWIEGQANWFSFAPGLYDERLRHLGTLQKLPSLTGEISLDAVQADGRVDLGYDMGASFVNWLVATQGGIETHRQIVARMAGGASLYDAVEQVAGQSFFDLQNAWRVYLDLPPFTLADLDPAAALDPIPDPLFAVGDVITLPPTPPLLSLYAIPQPRALIGGQCFAGMQATVLQAGRRDGIDYYRLDCMGMTGWVAGDQIAGANKP